MAHGESSLETVAHALAEFAFALRYDAIPTAVLALAQRHLADTLACAIGARPTATVGAIEKHALAQGGRRHATIIGTARKAPAGRAALANGTMIRQLDANDIFVTSPGGPSGHFSDSSAALLALAEKYRRTGKELITCLVASYELQGALAQSVNFWESGLHPLTNVVWTAPIVAARLVGTTSAQAVHACGLAAATGTVLNTWIRPATNIPTIKSAAVGLAGQRAVEAAELAAAGVTATDDAMETILDKLSPAPSARFSAHALEHLGARWTMSRNMLKRYPAQIHTQAAIEAALELHRRGIRDGQVRKLVLHGHRKVCGGVQGSNHAFAPASRETADHSTPYVVAMALLRGRLTPREYDGAPWAAAEVKRAMAKIELVLDPAMDRAFAADGNLGVRLVAELNDGRTEEIVVEQPKGHPDCPLSDAELIDKMSWLMPNSANAQRLLDVCQSLPSAENLAELLDSCRVESA